jgi:hypothetical protein
MYDYATGTLKALEGHEAPILDHRIACEVVLVEGMHRVGIEPTTQ